MDSVVRKVSAVMTLKQHRANSTSTATAIRASLAWIGRDTRWPPVYTAVQSARVNSVLGKNVAAALCTPRI